MPNKRLLAYCLLPLLLTAAAPEAFPETYYVDAIAGSDAAKGTTQQSPWQSMTKVNSVPLQPGDIVLFKRGETWRSPLSITHSGTAARPIIYGAYGSGDRPAIDLTAQVSGWRKYRGAIYETDLPSAATQLFVDGNYIEKARHPNEGFLYPGRETGARTGLVADGLDEETCEKLAGAELSMRTAADRWESRIVAGTDPAMRRLRWDEPFLSSIKRNTAFYLAGQLWMLDAPGEWFCDEEARKLYLWLPDGGDPNAHRVEVSCHNNGISSIGKHYIELQDLSVRNASVNGVYLSNGTGICLVNLELSGAGQDGLALYNIHQAEIVRCNVRDSGRNGISAASCTGLTIVSGEFSGNGMAGTMPRHSEAAVRLAACTNSVLRNNRFSRCAGAGIRCSGTGNTIERNVIDNSSLVLGETGAIHVSGAGNWGNRIAGNIILAAGAYGIVLDDRTHETTVADNSICGAEGGILLRNAFGNTVSGNNVVKARSSALSIVEEEDAGEPGLVQHNGIKGNVLVTEPGAKACLLLNGIRDGRIFGSADENRFGHYFATPAVRRSSGTRDDCYSVRDWYNCSGQERHSIDLDGIYPEPRMKVATTELVGNGGFDEATDGWESIPAGNSQCVAGLDGACLKAFGGETGNGKGAVVRSAGFSLKKGTTYLLVLDAAAAESSVPFDAALRMPLLPREQVAVRHQRTTKERRRYGMLFTPEADVREARLELSCANSGGACLVDGISVRAATEERDDASGDVVFFYNPCPFEQTINLGHQQYADPDGTFISGSFQLQPYSSRVLFGSIGVAVDDSAVDTVVEGNGAAKRVTVCSAGMPKGILPAGTKQVLLSVATSRPTNCRYAASRGTAFEAMQPFSETGGTMHATRVSGLKGGRTYVWYVKCRDADGNATPEDYVISFRVAADPSVSSAPKRFRGLRGK